MASEPLWKLRVRYFTPELIARGQTEDDELLDRHEEEWEKVGERYARYLEEVQTDFPTGLRRLLTRYYLHDARVHTLAQRDHFFLITLRLDTPPHSLLTFRYRLLCPAEINREALPDALRSPGPV